MAGGSQVACQLLPEGGCALNVYLDALSDHYADFRTRTRRREFLLYSLCNGAVYAVFMVAIALEGGVTGAPNDRQLAATGFTSLALLVYAAATLVPTLAITVRRMYDTGRSGRNLWRMVVPNSLLWFLLNTTFDSQHGTNMWGPNPKGVEVPAVED